MEWLYKLFCCKCVNKPTHVRGNTVIDIREALRDADPLPQHRLPPTSSLVVEYSSRKDRPCDRGMVRSKTVPILTREQMVELRNG